MEIKDIIKKGIAINFKTLVNYENNKHVLSEINSICDDHRLSGCVNYDIRGALNENNRRNY